MATESGEQIDILDNTPEDDDSGSGTIAFTSQIFGNDLSVDVVSTEDETGLHIHTGLLISAVELSEDVEIHINVSELEREDTVALFGVRGHVQQDVRWEVSSAGCGEKPGELFFEGGRDFDAGDLVDVVDSPAVIEIACGASIRIGVGTSRMTEDGFIAIESRLRLHDRAANSHPETALSAPLDELVVPLAGSTGSGDACSSLSSPTLWYTRTASIDGKLTVDNRDAAFPLTFAVFSEASILERDPLACATDLLEFPISAGETVHISVAAAQPGDVLDVLDEVSVGFTESIKSPRDLVCVGDGDSVRLEWINGSEYETVAIEVNGDVVSTLAGDATSTQIKRPGAGDFDVCIRGVLEVPEGVESGAVCCSDLEPFRRGDINMDGEIDIADSIALLQCLFRGSTICTCPAASDTNGDERVDVADPVAILNWQFRNGPPPPPPNTECGLANSVLICRATSPGCPPIFAQQQDGDPPPPAPDNDTRTRTRRRVGDCEVGVDMRLRVTDASNREIPKKTKRGILFASLKPGIRIKSNSKIIIQSGNAAVGPYEGHVLFEFFRGRAGQQLFHMFGRDIESPEALRELVQGSPAPELTAPPGMSSQNSMVTEKLRVKMTWDPDDPSDPEQCSVESSLTIRWLYEGPSGPPGWSLISTVKLGKFKPGKSRTRFDPDLEEIPFDDTTNHATHTEVSFAVVDPFVCCEDRTREYTIIQFVRHKWKLGSDPTRQDDWNLDGPDSQHENHSQGMDYDPTYAGNSQLVEFGPWGGGGGGGAVTVTDFPGLPDRIHDEFVRRGGKMTWEFWTFLVCREDPPTAERYLSHSEVRAFVRYQISRTYKAGQEMPKVVGWDVKPKTFRPCVSLRSVLEGGDLLTPFNNPREHEIDFGG